MTTTDTVFGRASLTVLSHWSSHICRSSFVAGVEPIDAGTAANTGVGGTVTGMESEYAFLNSNFGGRLRAYCQSGDAFCNSGFDQGGSGSQAALNIHYAETATYQSDATAFLTGLL